MKSPRRFAEELALTLCERRVIDPAQVPGIIAEAEAVIQRAMTEKRDIYERVFPRYPTEY